MKHVVFGALLASPLTTVVAFIGPYNSGWPLIASIIGPPLGAVLFYKVVERLVR